jgi:hypothetical protein
MKKKKPIFTYIITILNSFIPATVMAILGTALIIGTTNDGQALRFNGLFSSSVIFGYTFCVVISLTYFYLIRRERITPRWWTNILLILLSYLSIPTHAFAYAKTIGISADRYNGNFISGSLTFEALLLAVIGFTWIGIRTKKSPEKKKIENKRTKLSYLKWILFPLFYYIALFASTMLMVILMKMNFYITGTLARIASLLIRLPLYNDATKDFISVHFSGLKGHIIFLTNALIWGIVIWFIGRLLKKKSQPGRGPYAENAD